MTHSTWKVYIAGHRGMVGSALVRALSKAGVRDVVTRARVELDLTDQRAVYDFLQQERPDYVFMAAARVGGINANNTYRAEFIYENLAMETNVIHGSHLAGVQHLMLLGSSCVYPRECPQPMREDHLLAGPLESTNEPYAVAKIAGIKMCDAYRNQYARNYFSVMPSNLYGPNDNYDLDTSHVLPALIRKAHEAKVRGDEELVVWGSGNPRREFLFVDDLAEACVFLMQRERSGCSPMPSLLNIGWGEDLTIRELAETVMDVVGFSGRIRFDPSKPDGTQRKLLDTSVMRNLGWSPHTKLRDGIRVSFEDYLARTAKS